ncbi:MAG: hypothetical protein H7843_09165 [Nitrospirota bacterium]
MTEEKEIPYQDQNRNAFKVSPYLISDLGVDDLEKALNAVRETLKLYETLGLTKGEAKLAFSLAGRII